MNQFNVIPFESCGPLTFAMTRDQVELVLGPAQMETVTFLGHIEESRPHIFVRYDKLTKLLAEVSFDGSVNVVLGEIRLIPTPECVSMLLTLDGNPEEIYEFVVFHELGIALSGVAPTNEGSPSICIFRRGRWKEVMAAALKGI